MKINKGDTIKITGASLYPVIATVLTANNYPDTEYNAETGKFEHVKDCWYIECLDEAGRYRYWKQDPDGGEVELVSKA